MLLLLLMVVVVVAGVMVTIAAVLVPVGRRAVAIAVGRLSVGSGSAVVGGRAGRRVNPGDVMWGYSSPPPASAALSPTTPSVPRDSCTKERNITVVGCLSALGRTYSTAYRASLSFVFSTLVGWVTKGVGWRAAESRMGACSCEIMPGCGTKPHSMISQAVVPSQRGEYSLLLPSFLRPGRAAPGPYSNNSYFLSFPLKNSIPK